MWHGLQWTWYIVLLLPTRSLESQQEIKINEKPALENTCRILAYSLPAHEIELAVMSTDGAVCAESCHVIVWVCRGCVGF